MLKRCSISFVAFLLAPLRTSATYRHGDVVSMTYRTSQLTGRAKENQEETPWEEALRSQMPRFGRPGTVRFKNSLPAEGAAFSPEIERELAVAFAFSQEQFLLRRVWLREGRGGGEGGPRLSRVVIAFTCSAGDIVRVRCDPVYGGGGGVAADNEGFDFDFDVEYRWDSLPDEDEQAGVWIVFAASLVLTVVLAVDTCNSTAGGGGDGGGDDWGEDQTAGGPPPPSPSPSSLAGEGRRGHGDAGARAGRRVGSGGGALRPGGLEERRRRR